MSVRGIVDNLSNDAYGLCGLKPEEFYKLTFKEFFQMRDAKMEMERAHDLQLAQLSYVMMALWAGGNNIPSISDFMVFPMAEAESKQQAPDEQLRHVEGMNAIMGGGQ